MQKDFDKWNSVKKIVNDKFQNAFFYPREIWWCSLGLNVGSEEDGKNEQFERPVLILKVFNKDTVRIVPLTSKIKNDINHVPITYNNNNNSVKLSQLKTISSKRLTRKLGRLDNIQFERIVRILIKNLV